MTRPRTATTTAHARQSLSHDRGRETPHTGPSAATRSRSRSRAESAHAKGIRRPYGLLLGVLLLAAAAGASEAVSGPEDAPAPEARLVRAYGLLQSRQGTEALAEFRAIAVDAPDWPTARLALGGALLRRGLFAEARREYTGAIGEAKAAAIENGEAASSDLSPDLLDALLGLAICRDEEGATRQADRLYRAYADEIGAMTPNASRAFYRLAAMLERTGVPWGDAEAERARALALDPGVESAGTLPPLPDLGADPASEPYTRVVELDEADAPDDAAEITPPVLVRYAVPSTPDTMVAGASTSEMLSVGLTVTADGSVDDVRIEGCETLDCEQLIAITFAASRWWFEPAMQDGSPVAADVRFPVPVAQRTAPTREPSASSAQQGSSEAGGSDERPQGRGDTGGQPSDERYRP